MTQERHLCWCRGSQMDLTWGTGGRKRDKQRPIIWSLEWVLTLSYGTRWWKKSAKKDLLVVFENPLIKTTYKVLWVRDKLIYLLYFIMANMDCQAFNWQVFNAGLVPKAGGLTRMIFHLSHPQTNSVNYHTPRELCTTQYNEFDVAVRLCIKAGVGAHMARSDLKSGKFLTWGRYFTPKTNRNCRYQS